MDQIVRIKVHTWRRVLKVGAVGVGIVFLPLAAVYLTALAEWGIR